MSDEIAALAARLQALEDELAIHRLLSRYGFAVDSGDPQASGALFTEDSVTYIDGERFIMRGRKAIEEMVEGAEHQAVLPGSAHTIGPIAVEVDGDRAEATGYSRLYVSRSGQDDADYDVNAPPEITIFRVSVNHWKLIREGDGWKIAERHTRLIGSAEAQTVLHGGL